MKIKGSEQLWLLVIVFIISIVFYIWLVNSPYFSLLLNWSKQNILTFSLSLLSLKVASIVYPPLPGGLATLASIPFLGWKLAYLIDFIGSMIGSSIAFFIARKYGFIFLSKIFDSKTIQKIKTIEVYPKRQIESVFALRILLGTTIMEAVCYGAGLLNITFKNFLVGSILSHLAIGIPTYYLANNITQLRNLPFTVIVILAGGFIFWKLKNRYFKTKLVH